MGQVTFHPLADYAALAEYRFPDYKNPARYQAARAAVRARAGDKFVLAQLPFSLLQRLEYLRGSPAAWMDPYTHPAELRQLLHSLADVAIAALDHFAALGAHGSNAVRRIVICARFLCVFGSDGRAADHDLCI